jgi:putative cardiolipin synthase
MWKRFHAALVAILALLFWLPALLGGCVSLPLDYPRPVSTAISLPEKTRMGQRIQARVVRHRGKSGFYLLPGGDDSYMARILAIDRAERTLDLQYYIFNDDLTGKFLMDRLVAAAERGVRVRILVDDWAQAGKMAWGLALIQTSPNIQVRAFNPFGGLRSFLPFRTFQAVFVAKRLRARMHNKAFIADNCVAIVGGRNIGDEYFGARADLIFSDLDIVAIGPITRQISAAFDDYWNCALSIPIQALVKHQPPSPEEARRFFAENRKSLQNSTYAQKLQDAKLTKEVEAGYVPFVWAEGEVLYDDPLKVVRSVDSDHTPMMGRKLKALIDEAQSEVLIISPYFIPGPGGIRWFSQLRGRGLTVKVLTNSLASTDVPITEGGYAHYRKALLGAGVELYELKPNPDQYRYWDRTRLGSSSRGALHAKTFIVDRKVVFVGSFNLDPRSFKLNTENGIVVRSAQLGAQAARLFERGTSAEDAYRVEILGDSPVSEEWHGLVWITAENGRETRYYLDPMTGFWQRFSVRILSWFAPESML